MRYFLDTKFIETGALYPIMPISIGIVSETGEEYYAEFADVDWDRAGQWVLDNVKPHLKGEEKTREEISQEIVEFVGENPEFWSYRADYNWVLLCQLYGRMIELPKTWPFFCLDIKQYMWHFGIDKDQMNIPNLQEHDTLENAKWNRKAFLWMMNYQEMLEG